MRSLEEIFGSLDASTREVLFEDGMWCLYRRFSRLSGIYYIIHRCDKVTMAHTIKKDFCVCGEALPVALKGLFLLNAWER